MTTLRERRCRPCNAETQAFDEKTAALRAASEIPRWRLEGSALRRTFRFPDFRTAMRFVNELGTLAEIHDHHPDFDVRYREVHVTLITHVAGGITENDFILAAHIDALPSVSTTD